MDQAEGAECNELLEKVLSFGDRKQSENTVCAVCAGYLIPVDSWLVAVSRPLCNTGRYY